MLLQLHIENFAIADNLTLEFEPRLNVLTGETGAGKSILIDAIRFVLGERLDQIRFQTSGKAAIVEAIFEVPKHVRENDPVFASVIQDDDDVLILRREAQPQGKSRIWINNRIANATTLKLIGSYLLDIHGQYDHQQLFNRKAHLEMIDRLGKTDELKEKYQGLYGQYQTLEKKKKELADIQDGRERELDLLKYQIEELEQVDPKADEENELHTERIRLANSEKLYELAASALVSLDEEDGSASPLMGRAVRDFESLTRLDESLSELKDELSDAQLKLEEVIRTLRDYKENLSFDPDRLTEIDQRLDQLELIKRKYGGSLDKAREYLIEAKDKYDTLLNSELYGQEVEENLNKITPKLKATAKQLSEKRKQTASSLKKVIERELKDLKIMDAKFETRMETIDFHAEGSDQLEFLMCLNAGQPLLELRKIVSGGEVSRVMLAMKKALMKVDPVPTLIFDEIDANIGGRLGTVTGEKLKEIADKRQVLLVTHLPQIASYADRHFKVSKSTKQGKAAANYKLIEGEERVKELAQMMSGHDESSISKEHAKEMLARVK